MKTIYFIVPVLLFVSLQGTAQLTLTKAANEPVSGDVYAMVSHDSTTAVQKNTGTGQSWNFTSFTSPSFTEVITYTTAASVPQSSLFPGATIAALRGQNNKEFLMSSGSDWYFMGEHISPSNELLVLSNTALFMTWPVSISNTFSDVASGTTVLNSNTTALTATLSYNASGSGTVTLPGGAIHNNCLQLTNTLVVVTGTGTGASTMTSISYRYFSNSRKFAIADIQYSQETSSTGTIKKFGSYFDRQAATGVPLIAASNVFDLYPNPTNGLVNLSLPSGFENSTIEIWDVQGRSVLRKPCEPTINVSSLPAGVYHVSIKTAEQNLEKRLIITR